MFLLLLLLYVGLLKLRVCLGMNDILLGLLFVVFWFFDVFFGLLLRIDFLVLVFVGELFVEFSLGGWEGGVLFFVVFVVI